MRKSERGHVDRLFVTHYAEPRGTGSEAIGDQTHGRTG